MNRRALVIAAIVLGVIVCGFYVVSGVYNWIVRNDMPESARLEYIDYPVVGNQVRARFVATAEGDKLPECLYRKVRKVAVGDKEYHNLIVRTPDKRIFDYLPWASFPQDNKRKTFHFTFKADQWGDYMFFSCPTEDPKADDVSRFVIKVEKAPEVVSDAGKGNKPSTVPKAEESPSIAQQVEQQVKKQVNLVLEKERQAITANAAAEVRKAVEAANQRIAAVEAKAEAAVAGKVSQGDFNPVRDMALDTAKKAELHSNQMSRWQNLEKDVKSVQDDVEKTKWVVRDIGAQQVKHGQSLTSVAVVAEDARRTARGVANVKVNKVFGLGGSRQKNTEEFRQEYGHVDFDKQSAELAAHIAEVERLAGRVPGAQTAVNNGDKKLRKR